jgi:hypothetical protein
MNSYDYYHNSQDISSIVIKKKTRNWRNVALAQINVNFEISLMFFSQIFSKKLG